MMTFLYPAGMDAPRQRWYIPAMAQNPIPFWQLYGETAALPDFLHVEQVVDRAAGLDWIIRPHRHFNLHQIFFLASGDIRMTLDGAPQTLETPAVVNIPRGAVHGFSFSAGTEGYVVTLPAIEFPELFGETSETALYLAQPFISPADSVLAQHFHDLALAHQSSHPFRRTSLHAKVAGLSACMLENAHSPIDLRMTRDARIQRFEALVRTHIGDHFNLAAFAERLALSPRHLGRLCKAETGLSPQSYVESQKMREACRLLAYTRMTAQQIAYQLGFDDPSHFSRVFRRCIRQSPTAYRSRFNG